MKRSHGRGLEASGTYNIWKMMRRRCLSPSCSSYKDYGARGITVCEEWNSFLQFVADMGESNGLTLERKDVNGNYRKDNCIWIPKSDQRRNTRHTHRIEYNGIVKPLNEWASELGITGTALKYRIAKWGLERAMTEKPSEHHKNAGKASMESFAEKGFTRSGTHGKNFTPIESALDSWHKSSLSRATGERPQRVPRP